MYWIHLTAFSIDRAMQHFLIRSPVHWKGFVRKRLWPNHVLSRYLPKKTQKYHIQGEVSWPKVESTQNV